MHRKVTLFCSIMNSKKSICVVTPCLNAESYIADTMYSVVYNTAIMASNVNLYYFILDGKSQDNTVMVAREIADTAVSNNVHITIISEPDKGLYDAIAKGFSLCPSGDIYCYLGAGDYLSPYAFSIVIDVFDKGIKWVTGLKTIYNDASHIVSMRLPHRYRRKLIRTGFYGSWLNFIQQESTFWDAYLHSKLDFDQLSQYKLAGDYYIWKTFAYYEQLHIIRAWLGGFRRHPKQLSSDLKPYLDEMRTIRDKPGVSDYILALWDKAISYLPEEILLMINRHNILSYNPITRHYE